MERITPPRATMSASSTTPVTSRISAGKVNEETLMGTPVPLIESTKLDFRGIDSSLSGTFAANDETSSTCILDCGDSGGKDNSSWLLEKQLKAMPISSQSLNASVSMKGTTLPESRIPVLKNSLGRDSSAQSPLLYAPTPQISGGISSRTVTIGNTINNPSNGTYSVEAGSHSSPHPITHSPEPFHAEEGPLATSSTTGMVQEPSISKPAEPSLSTTTHVSQLASLQTGNETFNNYLVSMPLADYLSAHDMSETRRMTSEHTLQQCMESMHDLVRQAQEQPGLEEDIDGNAVVTSPGSDSSISETPRENMFRNRPLRTEFKTNHPIMTELKQPVLISSRLGSEEQQYLADSKLQGGENSNDLSEYVSEVALPSSGSMSPLLSDKTTPVPSENLEASLPSSISNEEIQPAPPGPEPSLIEINSQPARVEVLSRNFASGTTSTNSALSAQDVHVHSLSTCREDSGVMGPTVGNRSHQILAQPQSYLGSSTSSIPPYQTEFEVAALHPYSMSLHKTFQSESEPQDITDHCDIESPGLTSTSSRYESRLDKSPTEEVVIEVAGQMEPDVMMSPKIIPTTSETQETTRPDTPIDLSAVSVTSNESVASSYSSGGTRHVSRTLVDILADSYISFEEKLAAIKNFKRPTSSNTQSSTLTRSGSVGEYGSQSTTPTNTPRPMENVQAPSTNQSETSKVPEDSFFDMKEPWSSSVSEKHERYDEGTAETSTSGSPSKSCVGSLLGLGETAKEYSTLDLGSTNSSISGGVLDQPQQDDVDAMIREKAKALIYNQPLDSTPTKFTKAPETYPLHSLKQTDQSATTFPTLGSFPDKTTESPVEASADVFYSPSSSFVTAHDEKTARSDSASSIEVNVNETTLVKRTQSVSSDVSEGSTVLNPPCLDPTLQLSTSPKDGVSTENTQPESTIVQQLAVPSNCYPKMVEDKERSCSSISEGQILGKSTPAALHSEISTVTEPISPIERVSIDQEPSATDLTVTSSITITGVTPESSERPIAPTLDSYRPGEPALTEEGDTEEATLIESLNKIAESMSSNPEMGRLSYRSALTATTEASTGIPTILGMKKRSSLERQVDANGEASMLAGHISYSESPRVKEKLHQCQSHQTLEATSDGMTEYQDTPSTQAQPVSQGVIKTQGSPAASQLSLSQSSIPIDCWLPNRRTGIKDITSKMSNIVTDNQGSIESWLEKQPNPDEYTTYFGDATQYKSVNPSDRTTFLNSRAEHTIGSVTRNNNETRMHNLCQSQEQFDSVLQDSTIHSHISGVEHVHTRKGISPLSQPVKQMAIETDERIIEAKVQSTYSTLRIQLYATNLTDKELKVGLMIEEHLVDKKKVARHGLYFSPQINLTTSKQPQRFSMSFSTEIAGRHQITLCLTAQSQVLSKCYTTIQIDVEKPCVELLDNPQTVVDFGTMSYGCKRRIPITLVNKGHSDLELQISADETSCDRGQWLIYQHMYGTDTFDRPETPLYDISLRAGLEEISQKTVYIEYTTPSTHGSAGSPEEVTADIFVKPKQTRAPPALMIHTKLICGYGCVQFPGKYKVIELKSRPAQSSQFQIRCKNGGDVSSHVTFETRTNSCSSQFSVDPTALFLDAGEITTLSVSFTPTTDENSAASLEQRITGELKATLEPNGRQFKVDLLGVIEKPSPIPSHLSVYSSGLVPSRTRSNEKPRFKTKPSIIKFAAVPLEEKRYITVDMMSDYLEPVKVFLDVNHPSVLLVTTSNVKPGANSDETYSSEKTVVVHPNQPLPIRLILHSTHVGPVSCRLKCSCPEKSLSFRLPVYGYCGAASIEPSGLSAFHIGGKSLADTYVMSVGEPGDGREDFIKKVWIRNVGHMTAFVRLNPYTGPCCTCPLEAEKIMLVPHMLVIKPADVACVTVHLKFGEREKVLCAKGRETLAALKVYYIEESLRQIMIRNELKNPSHSNFMQQFLSRPADSNDGILLPDDSVNERLFRESVRKLIVTVYGEPPTTSNGVVKSLESRSVRLNAGQGIDVATKRLDFVSDIEDFQTYKVSIANKTNTDQQVRIQKPIHPFSIKSKSSASIRAGYSANLPIMFKPDSRGTFQSRVTIESMEGSFHHVIDLVGLCPT